MPAPRRSTTTVLSTSLLVQVAALRLDDTSAQAWENLASTLAAAGSLRIRVPTGASGMAVAVAVSSDGTLVASSNPVDGVQLYDAETLAPVAFDDRHPEQHGQVLAGRPGAGRGGQPVDRQSGRERIVPLPVRLYDLPGRRAVRPPARWLAGRQQRRLPLDFSRDGRRIAAGVNRWDDGRERLAEDRRRDGVGPCAGRRRPSSRSRCPTRPSPR